MVMVMKVWDVRVCGDFQKMKRLAWSNTVLAVRIKL